jgi:hypothetical protein
MMAIAPRALSLAAVLAAAPAHAQPAIGGGPPATFAPPRAYDGYARPGTTGCETTGVNRRACAAPAMTAGRHRVVAAGSATSNGANWAQSLVITPAGRVPDRRLGPRRILAMAASRDVAIELHRPNGRRNHP